MVCARGARISAAASFVVGGIVRVVVVIVGVRRRCPWTVGEFLEISPGRAWVFPRPRLVVIGFFLLPVPHSLLSVVELIVGGSITDNWGQAIRSLPTSRGKRTSRVVAHVVGQPSRCSRLFLCTRYTPRPSSFFRGLCFPCFF